MSISKPRILREQITWKPNLIWRTREDLLMEVTTKQDLRGWEGTREGTGEGAGRKGKYKWILKLLSVPGPLPWSLQGESTGGARGEFWIWDRVLWNSRMFLPAPVCLFPAHLPSLHYVIVMARSSNLSHPASRGTHWVKILSFSRMMLNVLNHNCHQPKMEKLYTVNKNKTRSWLWLRPWTPYCQIQTEIEESRENH